MSLPNIDVRLVKTIDDIAEFMEWLDERLRRREALAVDTETIGLNWWEYRFTRLFQIGDADSGWAIPIDWWGKVIEAAMEKVVAARIDVIFQNAAFDLHALEVEGCPVPDWSCVHDTKFLLHLRRSDLGSSLKGKNTADLLGQWIYAGQNALKDAAKRILGPGCIKDNSYWRLLPVDTPEYWGYGVLDTCLTRRVWDAVQDVRAEFHEQYERKRRVMQIMYRAEVRGLRLDVGYTERLQADLQAVMDRELHFCQANGLANPNSNNQVLALLEEDYGFVPWEFTESGNPSVNKNVLAELAKAGGMQEEVIQSMINYKRARKWKGTYADRFLNNVDHRGMVHPSINIMAARTGRWSVNNPPFQTLPSDDPLIRNCILAPKGHHWYAFDVSNQEPRALAHYGQSPQLLKYFTEGDGKGSIHDYVAEQMFGADYTKIQRGAAKAFGLGRSYGAEVSTLAKASGLSERDVEHILPTYDQVVGLANLKQMVAEVTEDRSPKYVVTKGGRRVYATEGEEFKLINYLCQGSGADMIDDAIIRIDDAGYGDLIQVQVHDEVDLAIPKDEPAIVGQIAKLMEDTSYDVPMPIDVEGPGKAWGSLYEKSK